MSMEKPKAENVKKLSSNLFKTENVKTSRTTKVRSALDQFTSEETTFLQYPKSAIVPPIFS